MKQQEASHTQGLTDAFQLFNQVSEQLASTYQHLELRIGRLNEELAAARNERLSEFAEKERLANRLGRLLDALPAGVVVINGDGVVQQYNAKVVDLIGEPLSGIAWHQVIKRAFRSSGSGDEATLKNGRIVSISTNPLGEEPGQIILLKDVTETRALHDMLHRHKRLSTIGEMSASLAHQIRTPLASSLLYLSHLQQADMSPQDHQRCVDKILSRLRHLDRLVNDMMLFARGGHAGAEKIDCYELLQELRQVMEPHMIVKHCDLKIKNITRGLMITGNHDALLSVLQNLVLNAIQACGENKDAARKGMVRISAAEDTEKKSIRTLVMLISDSGPGIPAEIQHKIFEPFVTTKPKGTGLGLAVVQAVINAHNGTVWVKSSNHEGTTIGIRLPVCQADEDGG